MEKPTPGNTIFINKKQGFSLIELSAILSIVAAATVGFLGWVQPAASTNAEKLVNTQKKMEKIVDALETFRVIHNRLPCPADPYMRNDNTYLSTQTDNKTNNFGEEDLDKDNTNELSTARTLGVNCLNTSGSVPTISLALDESYMYDEWNRRFTYHVSDNLCGTGPSVNIAIATEEELRTSKSQGCTPRDYSNGISGTPLGDLIVTDGSSNITTEAAFVVASHGPNGHGAILPSGEQLSQSVNSNEAENSDSIGTSDKTYVKTNLSSTYDDIVTFKTRDQLESAVKDDFTDLIKLELCKDVAETIKGITASDAQDMRSNMNDYEIGTGINASNKGDQVIISVLWGLQTACVQYYTSWTDANPDRSGPNCPGGGTYSNGACTCSDGSWDGSC